MPEIWLPYGDVEIPLEIKTENIDSVLELETNNVSDDDISEHIEHVKLNNSQLIIPKLTYNILRILKILNDPKYSESNEFSIVGSNESINYLQKQNLNFKFDSISNQKQHNLPIFEIINQYKSPVILNEIEFDPVYGVNGGPIDICKLFNSREVSESFFIDDVILPNSGLLTKHFEHIMSLLKNINDITTIEFVSYGEQITKINSGELLQIHNENVKELLNTNKLNIEHSAQGAIISPGKLEPFPTLSNSLQAIWNCYKTVTPKGPIGLVAESSFGFGSEALNLYVHNPPEFNKLLKEKTYVDGLEDVIFLNNIRKKYDLYLVSSLPQFYQKEILGFRPANKINDLLRNIIHNHGKKTEFIILPFACNVVVEVKI